jgi:glycosyltransferase involved in cell wall biosynthesis
MIHGKKIVVVMPAYQAESTLEKTYHDIPHDIVDDIILVDDASRDNTAAVAQKLGITTIIHEENTGYGGNQKTCYRQALKHRADIVVMLHPDYQYDPRLITSLASMIVSGVYDAVIGSRILGKGALKGGMPVYKYISNRFLTLVQNWMLRYKLSEYHTGYRAFSREILEKLPLSANSDDFLFDNEMMAQMIYFRYRLGEVSCPTRYLDDSSSVSFTNSVKYGLGVLWTCLRFVLQKASLAKFSIFLSKEPD